MSKLILTQTDTGLGGAGECGQIVGCAPGSVHSTFLASRIEDGGTPGVTGQLISFAGEQVLIAAGFMQTEDNVPNAVRWDAGPWVIRYNVSVGNMNIRLEELYVCRFDNACGSLATVGSLLAQDLQMTSGVKTLTVTGSEQAAGATDEIYIVARMRNNSMSAQSITIIPDQNIDTPIFIPMVALSEANFPDRNYYCGPFQP